MQSGRVRFLPIDHAAAMKIKYPAFNAAVIPEGAYLGNPPVPEWDFPTVSIHRTLLARDDASIRGVRAITEVLLISEVQEMDSLPPLAESWRELLNILSQAVRDLDADELSEESFNSFRAILQIGLEVTKERGALVTPITARKQ